MTSPGPFQTMFVGDRFLVHDGWCEVIKYEGKNFVTVKFDDTGSTSVGATSEIRLGCIRDKLKPKVYGVGFMGQEYKRSNKLTKLYSLWQGMLERCYSQNAAVKFPTYTDCCVHENWHNFSEFTKDVLLMIREDKWEIDKDILVKGNRMYSKETCVFLPKELNLLISTYDRSLPTGVYARGDKFIASCRVEGKQKHLGMFLSVESAFEMYKAIKEKEIKRLANIWKDRLDPKAYEALVNYTIDIND